MARGNRPTKRTVCFTKSRTLSAITANICHGVSGYFNASGSSKYVSCKMDAHPKFSSSARSRCTYRDPAAIAGSHIQTFAEEVLPKIAAYWVNPGTRGALYALALNHWVPAGMSMPNCPTQKIANMIIDFVSNSVLCFRAYTKSAII